MLTRDEGNALIQLFAPLVGGADDPDLVADFLPLADAEEDAWKARLASSLLPFEGRLGAESLRLAVAGLHKCATSRSDAEFFDGALFPFDPPGNEPVMFFAWVVDIVQGGFGDR